LGSVILDGIEITSLKIIKNVRGDIMHGLISSEEQYRGFGEAYFSKILKDQIKGWKAHKKMTMNLIVPYGEVKFVMYDDRDISSTKNKFYECTLSKDNYKRITIPPNIWLAFQGKNFEESIIFNLASISHDDNEVFKKDIKDINYNW
tara:strand:+ start:1191 stop:1631 length:441 start_codon:yes stop_codon:yes gene_type:complete